MDGNTTQDSKRLKSEPSSNLYKASRPEDFSFHAINGKKAKSVEDLDEHYSKMFCALRNEIFEQLVAQKAVNHLAELLKNATFGSVGPRAKEESALASPSVPRPKLQENAAKILTNEEWNLWHTLELDLLSDDVIAKRYGKKVPVDIKKQAANEKLGLSELTRVIQDDGVSKSMREKAAQLRALKAKFADGMRSIKGEGAYVPKNERMNI